MTDTTDQLTDLVATAGGELPEFEGRIPVGVNTNLQGAGQRITRALHHEDRIVLVVEAKVADIRHPMTKDGLKRNHVLKVEDLYELPGRRGQRLLTMLKKAWRLASDAEGGTPSLAGLDADGDGLEVTTDGAGVVLTPEDLSDLGLGDASNDPRVVIVATGARSMWPDDFPAGAPAPSAGDVVVVPGGDVESQVVELLDPLTGEQVARWSDEDEQARLLALEQEAAVEEARADVEAAEELTLGQQQNRQPWDGYDDMSAKDIVSHLTTVVDDPAVADHVHAYESVHKERAGVLRTADARAATLHRRALDALAGPDDDLMDDDLPPLPDDEDL